MATNIKTHVALKLCGLDCLIDTVLAQWLDTSTLNDPNDPTALLSDQVLPLHPCPPQKSLTALHCPKGPMWMRVACAGPCLQALMP